MSRANDDTQVDYSLLDDAALGNAVAGKVLSASYIRDGDYWELPGESFSSDDLVSWWGAGLVIDTLREEGYFFDVSDWGERGWEVEIYVRCSDVNANEGELDQLLGVAGLPPVRAILIAALRAKEAE